MEQLTAIVEALLFTSDKPLTLSVLRDRFAMHERPDNNSLRKIMDILTKRYAKSALTLTQTASGYRFVVKDEYASWVVRAQAHKVPRYSRAVLETLAIIAYRQPVTRADVESIRGVAVSSGVMRTLVDHGWVKVVGHREVPGRPALHATTKTFLDVFGLKRLDELPSLAQVKHMTENYQDNGEVMGKNQATQSALPLQEGDAQQLEGENKELNDEDCLLSGEHEVADC